MINLVTLFSNKESKFVNFRYNRQSEKCPL
nr:MAG TPA: hypothetical protein [Caudoviricetes sp.]